jgi:hypothetical protein
MTRTTIPLLLGAALMLGSLPACKTDKGQQEPAVTGGAEQADEKPGAVQAEPAKTEPKPEPAPELKAPPPPPKPEMMAGSHILIPWKGAMKASPEITRTKDEAKKLAQELFEKVNKDPEALAALAKKHSSGPSAQRGGSLGAWPKGRMVPEFDKAIATIKVGEVTGPVESPFGYHVIRRDALPPMHAGSHVLVAYKGAMRAAPNVTRSKEQARKLADQIAKEARADPEKFTELAKKHSDGPSGPRGGSLGVWPKGQMVPQFDTAIEKLKIGEISDPVETPFGFHVIKREDPDAK